MSKQKKSKPTHLFTFVSSKYILGFTEVEEKYRNSYFQDRIFY